MKQRGNGFGSVYQVGNRWVAAVTVAPGRRIERRAGTEREAKLILRQLIAQRDAGTLRTTGRQTLTEWLEHWVTITRRGDLRPHTQEQYTSVIRAHLVPSLGSLQLGTLTALPIDRMRATMIDAGYAANTVNQTLRILKTALGDAVRLGLIPKNPATDIRQVPTDGPERQHLSRAVVTGLLEGSSGTEWYALWLLLITLGLRIGEALALRWSDIDGDTLQIRHTLTTGGQSGLWLGPPKTRSSRRDLDIVPPIPDTLRLHSVLVKQRRIATRDWTDMDLLFPGTTGRPLWAKTAQKHLDAAMDALDAQRVTLHALRHTCATLHRDAGTPLEDLSRMLGHATIDQTANLYSHTPAERRRQNAERIGNLLMLREAR